MPLRYYLPLDHEQMTRAQSFADLFEVARNVIERMPKPVVQVCGPISTGGLGSRASNMERFTQVINTLVGIGIRIFNQMPFETHMDRIHETTWTEKTEYCMPILKDFYEPLFNLGHIRFAVFIPGWQTSTGSVWEHRQFQALQIPILHLPCYWEQNLNRLVNLFPSTVKHSN